MFQIISLLPSLSKVIEKPFVKQTTKFLNDKNILYKYQSGFRSNHSTEIYFYHFSMIRFESFERF